MLIQENKGAFTTVHAYYFSRVMVLTLPINMHISQSLDYKAELILHNMFS